MADNGRVRTGQGTDARLRIVAYVRVSTAAQGDGLGLPSQEKAVRSWCRSNGHKLVALTSDVGVSGTVEALDRPGLAEALSLVSDGKADALLVHRLDRLARSLTVQEAALSLIWRSGGRVFAVDGGEVLADDPDDPLKAFTRQVLGAAAQLEKGLIAARLRAARRLKAEAGGYAGNGSPRYGSRAVGGELVEDESEQLLLHRVRELRAAGASLRGIGETLTAEGFVPRRGKVWHPQVLARLVSRIEAAA